MHTIDNTSSADFKTYMWAGRSLGKYFPVSSEAKVQAHFVTCKVDIVHIEKQRFFTSESGVANTTWITKQVQVQSKTVFIASLGAVPLALKCALPITLEVSVKSVAAYSYDLDELAISDSECGALDEMRAGIAEAYFLLKAEQKALGPLQSRHWEFLRQIVAEL